MSGLTLAIRDALGAPDLVTAAIDVKQLVCDELARLDPSARIVRTDYFNHTFVPDVVVGWPNVASPREVFLRFLGPRGVQEDMDRVAATSPVLVDLSLATNPDALQETSAATRAAVEAHPSVLVTDTEATEHVRPDDSENLVERLVVSNLLRAGRGEFREEAAAHAVATARAGFDGASQLDPNAVRAAVDVARSYLSLDVERRVEKSMQLLWWAGGGASDDFPVSLPDDMTLDPSDTREFLRMVFADGQAVSDQDFWSRLADRIDFDMLVEVGEVRSSANLNLLMRALAPRLDLSHAVVDRHDRPLPPHDQLQWALSDGFLRLIGPDWSCRFTPHGNRFSQRRDEGVPIALRTAEERSRGLLVEEAELEEAARGVHLTRKATDLRPGRPGSLAGLTQGFEGDARLRSVVVRLGEHRLAAEYDRMMLSSSPDAPVLRMAAIATRLLLSLTASERLELDQFLGS